MIRYFNKSATSKLFSKLTNIFILKKRDHFSDFKYKLRSKGFLALLNMQKNSHQIIQKLSDSNNQLKNQFENYQNLENNKNELVNTLDDLNTRFIQIEEKNNSLENSLKNKQVEKLEMIKKIKELEINLDLTKKTNNELNERIKEINKNLENEKYDKNELEITFKDFKKKTKAQENEFGFKLKEFEKEKMDQMENLKNLENEKKKLKSMILELNNCKEVIIEEAEELDENVKTLKNKILFLEKKNKTCKQKNIFLENSFKKIIKNLEIFKTEYNNLLNNNKDLFKELKNKNDDIEQKDKSIKKLDEALKNSEKKSSQLKKQHEIMTELFNKNKIDTRELLKEIKTKTTRVNQVEKEFENKEKEYFELANKLKVTLEENENLKKHSSCNLKTQNKKLDELFEENNFLRSENLKKDKRILFFENFEKKIKFSNDQKFQEMNITIHKLNKEKIEFFKEITILNDKILKENKEKKKLKSQIEHHQTIIVNYKNELNEYKNIAHQLSMQKETINLKQEKKNPSNNIKRYEQSELQEKINGAFHFDNLDDEVEIQNLKEKYKDKNSLINKEILPKSLKEDQNQLIINQEKEEEEHKVIEKYKMDDLKEINDRISKIKAKYNVNL